MTDVNKSNYLIALAIIALVIVNVFAIMRPTMVATSLGNNSNNPTQRTITVNGAGTVETAPDEVLLNLAVNNQATTAAQAASDNANTMSQVVQAILGLSSLSPGITKNDITTTDYSLTPVYSQPNNNCYTASSPPQQQPIICTTATQQLIGYAVRNAIQVTVKDMTSIGRVLDAATQSGANEVGGITFTFTDGTFADLQKQALQKAVQDAVKSSSDGGKCTWSSHNWSCIRHSSLLVSTIHECQTERREQWNTDANSDWNLTGQSERASNLRNIRII